MSFDDLRQWIAALDRAGELKKIKTEVDPILEITEIADRVSKGAAKKYGRPGGPALLFENVKGANGVPVLINQFGSERRMQMALGVDSLDEIAERIRHISVLDRANVEVIAGINLPMLIKLAGMREGHTLQAAVTAAQEAGRKYINVASQLLAARG